MLLATYLKSTTLHSNMFLLILGEPKEYSFRLIFTFQYVSINTSLDEVFGYQEASLHSNMFLLIPKTDSP